MNKYLVLAGCVPQGYFNLTNMKKEKKMLCKYKFFVLIGAPKASYIQVSARSRVIKKGFLIFNKHLTSQGLSVIGVQQIDRIVEVVEETLKGNSVRLMGKKKKDNKKYGGASLSLPKVRRNPLIEIIAINTGYEDKINEIKAFVIPRIFKRVNLFLIINRRCLNECTYCKTKHARGELGSYHIDEIVDRVKQSFQGFNHNSMLMLT